MLAPQKYNRLTVQTSRGCPHKCEFCASSILLTPRYKLKPVEKVIAEIREIKKIWPRPFIEFADDNSFVHRDHYKKLLRELAQEEVRWFTEADVSVAADDELLGLLRDSGCQQVLIGLESPRRANLNGIELKNNWKARQQDHYKSAIAKLVTEKQFGETGSSYKLQQWQNCCIRRWVEHAFSGVHDYPQLLRRALAPGVMFLVASAAKAGFRSSISNAPLKRCST